MGLGSTHPGLSNDEFGLLKYLINAAVDKGNISNLVDLEESLRHNPLVSNALLDDRFLRARYDLFIDSIQRHTYAHLGSHPGSHSRSHPGAHDPPSPPGTAEFDEALPHHHRRAIHAVDDSNREIEHDGVVEMLSDEKAGHLSLSCDGRLTWEGGTYGLCKGTNSFINTDIAKGLGIDATVGTQHRLTFRVVEGPNKTTQARLFTVVDEETMHVDIALGSSVALSPELKGRDDAVAEIAPLPTPGENIDTHARRGQAPLPVSSETVEQPDLPIVGSRPYIELLATLATANSNIAAANRMITEEVMMHVRSKCGLSRSAIPTATVPSSRVDLS
jgi:hypothetical protein